MIRTDIEMMQAQLNVVIEAKRKDEKYADFLLFISKLLSEYDENYYLDKQEMKEVTEKVLNDLYGDFEQ